MSERRLARVAISFEFLIELLTQDNVVSAVKTTKGIPADATFLYTYADDGSGQAYAIFEHESFDVVRLGGFIPTIPVEYMKYYGDAALELIAEESANNVP